MNDNTIHEQLGKELGSVLRARGLPETTTLAELAADADTATEQFLARLPGYPHSMTIAAEQYAFAVSHIRASIAHAG